MLFGPDWLSNVFMGTFIFGLLFTIVSLVLGFVNSGDLPLPHFGGDGHAGGLGDAGGHVGDVGGHDLGAAGHDTGGAHADVHTGPGVLNMPTIMAFITWFGGVGYLLRQSLGLSGYLAVPLAVASGVIGGAVMFAVLARVLWPMMSKPLKDEDYRLPGTLARVVSSIRAGGVGEIVYEKAGSRFTAGARAAGSEAIAKGTEVVVLGYEKGLATVRSVDDLLEEREQSGREETTNA